MAEKKQDPKTEEANDRAEAPRRRLLRSPRERVLWGVCGGLGDYLNVDPTWVRLGFVAAVLFGGFGLLAYLVMAVVVPEDDGSGNPVSGQRPPTWALVLLGLAVLFALPGPLWGWGWGGPHWWWDFAGAFWLGVLILAGVLAYRALSGRPLDLFRRRGGDDPTKAKAKAADEPEAGGGPPRIARALALIAIVLIGFSAAAAMAVISGWATATGNGAVIAGVVIALGVALGATAFFADSRQAAPWLLGLALILALPAGAVAAGDVRFDGGIGQRDHRPTVATDIPADGYELGIGQLIVDLRDLPWSEGQVVPLRTELGIGQLIVAVPTEVCVTGEADIKGGELLVRGDATGGVDAEFDRGTPAGNAPRLELDAEMQFGQLVVTDDDPDEVDDEHDRRGDDEDEIAAAEEACQR